MVQLFSQALCAQLDAWDKQKIDLPSVQDLIKITSPGRLEAFDNKVAKIAGEQSALIVAQSHILQERVMQALQEESYAASAPHVLHTEKTYGQQQKEAAAKQARANRTLLRSHKRAAVIGSVADLPLPKTKGGLHVPKHCKLCGEPRINTHGRDTCPTFCCKCKQIKKDCICQKV